VNGASGLRQFEAIVIGASSGGIEALSVLLPAFRSDLQGTVFVVVHLPRQRPSLLVDVVSHRCALRVREAQDKEPIERGTLYVAPPDYHLLIDKGPQIALSIDEPINFSRPSIDALFESAADVYGDRLLGIILSGANEDGAGGLAAVRRRGGAAFVQDPTEAGCPIMIAAALKRTPDAQVLNLEKMRQRMAQLGAGPITHVKD